MSTDREQFAPWAEGEDEEYVEWLLGLSPESMDKLAGNIDRLTRSRKRTPPSDTPSQN